MKVLAFFTTIFLSALLVPRPAAHAQLFPVQCTPQLVPPYSVYLSDYASPGNERLRVILVQRDLSQPSYQLRLVMSIELNGRIIMRTSRTFTPPPLNLEPGIPTIISGPDLAGYLDSRNIDFVGYSREQYERTRALPEGSYRILFTAYDYRRQDVQVSNEGSSFYYLAKNEPPLINFPPCGTRLPTRNPYQIVFSWMPRNTASPNSAAETQYEFSLYETRPPGRNPNDVVLTTPPIYRAVTDFPQLVYGPAEPLLFEGMQYVWRVQAQDKNGRDAFRNNGFTEVCTFTYGGTDISFEVGMLKGLQAQGETERRARIWWEAGDYDNYRIEYKKTGQGFEWFRSDVKAQANGVPNLEIKLFDLEPDTEYETRAQGMKAGVFGPYTDVIKFRTTPLRVAQCGQPTVLPTSTGKPIPFLTSGMIINARGMELQMVNATVADVDGWYKGTGRVSVPYLGGAVFNVKFDRIFIDADRNVTAGRIDFVTKGVAAMVEQQLAGQQNRERERKQRENREQWKDVVFYEKIFKYDMPIISAVVGDNDAIVLYDQQNIQHINRDIATVLQEHPGKAVVIEDKNGEQYVVQKDKTTGKTTVTKVEGGGLIFGPDGKMLPEKEIRTFEKKVLAAVRKIKKSIEDYWAANNISPPKGRGGPSYPFEFDIATTLKDLPSCLNAHKDKLEQVFLNFNTLGDSTSVYSGRFVSRLSTVVTEAENASDEKIENAVCEAGIEDVLRNRVYNLAGFQNQLEKTYSGLFASGPFECFVAGWERYQEVDEEYDSEEIAWYAAVVKTALCFTEKERCKKDPFNCGFTNGILQEMDWITFIDDIKDFSITKEDVKKMLTCVVREIPIGEQEGDPTINQVIFKCATGVDYVQLKDGIKAFIEENWTDKYYQGQATAFALTLIGPLKAGIIRKLKSLPKFSQFAARIGSFEALAKANKVDDFNAVARGLAKGADDLASLVKRFDNLTPDELKQLYSRISKTEINSSSKITRTQKDILTELEQRGITNPYNFAHPIEDIMLSSETIFIRIHSSTNQARPWLVAIEDFKGFKSTDDLIKKLALPVLDNSGNLITQKISFAKIPAGVKVRKSVVRPQDWPGQGHQPGGATQFEIIEQRATETWFKELGNLSEFK